MHAGRGGRVGAGRCRRRDRRRRGLVLLADPRVGHAVDAHLAEGTDGRQSGLVAAGALGRPVAVADLRGIRAQGDQREVLLVGALGRGFAKVLVV